MLEITKIQRQNLQKIEVIWVLPSLDTSSEYIKKRIIFKRKLFTRTHTFTIAYIQISHIMCEIVLVYSCSKCFEKNLTTSDWRINLRLDTNSTKKIPLLGKTNTAHSDLLEHLKQLLIKLIGQEIWDSIN